jgi:hypothetical protein
LLHEASKIFLHMETPKSQLPPQVHFTTDGIRGWDEFVCWASRNHWLWNSAVNYSAKAGLGEIGALKIVAYHMILENKEMKDAVTKHVETHAYPLFVPLAPSPT